MRRFFLGSIFLWFSFSLNAEFFSSAVYGWTLDLPEGFFASEANENENDASYFFEHSFLKVRLAIKIFPSNKKANENALEKCLQKLSAKGEIDNFLWQTRLACVAQYRFSLQGLSEEQRGWGVSAQLPKSENEIVLLCYSDSSTFELLEQFIISTLDSLFVEKSDFRAPGILTCYAYPCQEEKEIALFFPSQEFSLGATPQNSMGSNNGAKKIATKIPSCAKESGRFVIDREFSVLSLYANKKNWKEAWQRYYRTIFRESYSRLDRASNDIYKTLCPAAAQKNPANPNLEIAKTLLSQLQNFAYARENNQSDFNDLASVLQNQGSDCDSRALLLCVLLEHYGIKTKLFVSMEYSHALCGVNFSENGAKINVDGIDYLLCETTAKVEMGLIAAEHSETSKWIAVDLP